MKHARSALAVLTILAACRSMQSSPERRPQPGPEREPEPAAAAADSDEAVSDSLAAVVAAIIDSVRMEVRDSIAAEAARGSRQAAARDSARAGAVRDSLKAVAMRDSVRAAAVRDSVRALAVRDSIRAAFVRDSVAAAVRDSLRAAAVRDSVEAAARDSARAAAEEAGRAAPVDDELEELRKLGPAYIPYDRGPRAVWTTDTQASLTRTLLPVLREQGLPARTRAIFWILVRRDGTVDDLVLQTGSGNRAFDEAAQRFARMLEFVPALRANRPVATWVLREISILMQ